MMKPLTGTKIAILVANGFDEENFLAAQKAVLEMGATVRLISSNQGLVNGWGDARMPTVRGAVRRGVNVTALRSFMYSQGASRRVVNMIWTKFWAENKKEIDKKAKRFMAIDKEKHVLLRITNSPSEADHAYLETQVHPKDPSLCLCMLRAFDGCGEQCTFH